MSMLPHAARFPADTVDAHALMLVSGLRLLAPSGDLKTIETARELVTDAPPERGVGWVSAFGALWPAFALSKDLQLIVTKPTTREMFAVLPARDGLFGLLCEEIRMIDESGLTFSPLPLCMRYEDSPLGSIALVSEELYCDTDAAALARHIERLGGVSLGESSGRRVSA